MEFMKSFTWSTFISNGRLKKKGRKKTKSRFLLSSTLLASDHCYELNWAIQFGKSYINILDKKCASDENLFSTVPTLFTILGFKCLLKIQKPNHRRRKCGSEGSGELQPPNQVWRVGGCQSPQQDTSMKILAMCWYCFRHCKKHTCLLKLFWLILWYRNYRRWCISYPVKYARINCCSADFY